MTLLVGVELANTLRQLFAETDSLGIRGNIPELVHMSDVGLIVYVSVVSMV